MKEIIKNLNIILTVNPEFLKLGEENLYRLYMQKHGNLEYINFLEAYDMLMYGVILDDGELIDKKYEML